MNLHLVSFDKIHAQRRIHCAAIHAKSAFNAFRENNIRALIPADEIPLQNESPQVKSETMLGRLFTYHDDPAILHDEQDAF